jgi:aspartate racemase
MSWESTALYYRLINQKIRGRCGGLHSAPLLICSYNFAKIEPLQAQHLWEEAGAMLAETARRLETSGAEGLILATNTMHRVAPAVADRIGVPLIHIADSTAERAKACGVSMVGLLGTRFTMEEAFYRDHIASHGIDVLTPSPSDIPMVNAVIFEELCQGKILDTSRTEYRRVVADLASRGAEAIILGCTEIGLLLRQEDAEVPLLDSAEIHAEAAVNFILEGG